jgi:hypothetical protein
MKINITQAWVNDVEEFRVYANQELVATFPDQESAVEHIKELVTLKLEANEGE